MTFYLASAWRVQGITHPWSTRQPAAGLDDKDVLEFPDMASALAWADSEYDSIIDLYRKTAAIPELAHRFGPTLALAFFGYLESRAHWERMRFIYDLSISSVDADDDPSTLGWLHHDRAIPDAEQGHFELARSRMIMSLNHFSKAQDITGLARCCSSLSHVCERLNLLDEAVSWGERGLVLAQEAGDVSVVGTIPSGQQKCCSTSAPPSWHLVV